MAPWPEAETSSPFNMSPSNSQNQDPFAAFNGTAANTGAVPQCNNAPAQQQQQPPAPQNADPWAAMTAAPPAQAPPAPTMAPPAVPTQAPPAVAPPAQPQQLTPPPNTVFADNNNQAPPSPLGDVSVLAASANANAAPAVPNAMQNGMQPLQPAPAAQAPVAANPFDMAPVAESMPLAAPPASMPPQAPPTPPQAEQQQPVVAAQNNTLSPPTSPVPANAFSPHQQFADPFGYAFSPMTSPVTSPVTSPNASPGNNGAVVPSAMPNADPFGVGAPAQQQQAVVPSAAPNADPFGVFGSQPAPAPANADPFGGGALVTSAAPQPSAGAVDDPFGIFGSPTPAAPAPAQQAPAPAQQAAEEDPWAAAGFGQATSQPEQSQQPTQSAPMTTATYDPSISETKKEEKPITLDSNNLPSEGEYYEARINASSLGAMFYTARNLEETLYHKMPNNIIEALGSRPVVAFVTENSAAYNSGVHLGHVVLSVNGHEVSDPEYCANMIRNSPRPMNLRCYVPPDMELTINEGTHLVKYDTRDMEAPKSSMEWKKKYVVVGGIVTKPWMMNMFYRKKDYDVAVKEAHAGHKISVKVKQFDLRGARIILKGRDGKPNWVDYPNERKAWYYITVLPNKGYPIKISAPSLEELEPVYSAIRRFVRKDMESRYSYREESFGNRMMNAQAQAARATSTRANIPQQTKAFHQFNDEKRDSYWN